MSDEKIDFPCPVCGSTNLKPIYPDTIGERYPVFGYDFSIAHNSNYRLVKCNICTHHFASPRHENIYKHYKDVIDNAYLANETVYLITFENTLKRLLKVKSGGKLLDVGCSAGFFLEIASRHYQVEGMELSSWAIDIARNKGFKVHQSLLDNFKPDKLFDIITLWGVIEHFDKPVNEVKKIFELLNKEGIICFWTPNINSVTAKLLGRKWWNYQGQHIQMFTRKSITRLFEEHGFEKVCIGTYTYVMNMTSLHKSLARYPFIYRITKPILTSKFLRLKKICIKLPGEMFGIFRKKEQMHFADV